MATPAQCLANAANAQLSSGPKSKEGIAKVAQNGVRHGLFAAYERLAPAIADERANPESAALVEVYGEDILLGHALRHDAAGPNVFSKLMRYESRVMKELRRASYAYDRLMQITAAEKANPISRQKVEARQPAPPETSPQSPRNAPCPCGSGMKFKRCCGADSPAVLCAA
jgi:SEC-C motif